MYHAASASTILSLMALTIATGFVVDDAIVVLENIAHAIWRRECLQAALQGTREVGFTVISMKVCVAEVAVFLPLLLMERLRAIITRFAVTLSVAIGFRWWSRSR